MTEDSSKYVTPCEKHVEFGSKIGLKALFLKREDYHPYGSHKGRSIPYMIDVEANKGHKDFVISSSGNAGLSAAMHARKRGDITLDIFVGQNANHEKIQLIKQFENEKIKVIIKERPLQSLILSEQEGKTSLRQSTNDTALIGYKSLAEEIESKFFELKCKRGSLFIGTSSGTTAQALAQYFIDKDIPISVNIVQTSSCHPIADYFVSTNLPNETSTADAIVDKTARRKDVLVQLISKTGGRGYIVTNEELDIAKELILKYSNLELTSNGVLGIAGAMQAVITDLDADMPIFCIVGGR